MRYAVIICLIISLVSPILSYGELGRVRTEVVSDIDREKRYSLILYGARHGNDLESVAILDIDGDPYTFEPFAPSFDYEIEKGIDFSRAIKRARDFIFWHPLYRKSELRRITLSGRVIGYELRPLYDPLSYGLSDVLDIDYQLKDHRVIVKVRLKPQVERMIYNGDRREDDN